MSRTKFSLFPRHWGIYPYIWLIYMALFIYNMQFEHGVKKTIGYALLALFVVTYRQLYFVSGRAYDSWVGLQMLLSAILLTFYNPNYIFLGFYTANFISFYRDRRKFNIAYGVLAAYILLPMLFHLRAIDVSEYIFFIPFLATILASPFGMRSMHRRHQLEKELDQANEQIRELVKREERLRIARDLHDTLGHTLSLITLKSQLVEKLIAKQETDRAREEAREIGQTSRAALRQVRELVSDMRAVTVAQELVEAERMLGSAGIELQVRGDLSLEGVPDLTQNMLSLCVREAVTNIVKHSRAKNCRIQIERTNAVVRIRLQDDGIGLRSGSGMGNGLNGMSERLALIDGSLMLDSDESGTQLTVTVPIIVKDGKDGGGAA
ncbi:sensor histidine kinase [Paenibacillus thiaminolyticus]|uniref:sensor histidine kinase n=1 Tax=Paenibacillus thiaminolyticus TaxID=49283 RepID=UPI0011635E26|nr:sensor histidine kinase [Paenibacillus thiaminolyticus]MDG0874023.1 sensor histidine kinase [Paenibacillus thiaminolyticus]NGP58273.1 sensor histidine kinase [Paenibacillus thiaminolyticus]